MPKVDSADINYKLKSKNVFEKIFNQLNFLRPIIYYEDKRQTPESILDEEKRLIHPFIERVKAKTITDDPKILDLGAGSGTEAQIFRERGLDTTTLDLSREGLSAQNSDKKVQADALTTPFRDQAFAGVFSKDTMTHIHPNQIPQFMSELNRICDKNGIIQLVYADGAINRLGMRQYQHKQETIIEEANKLGLKLVEQSKYKPQIDDWYHPLKATRAVLSFAKE